MHIDDLAADAACRKRLDARTARPSGRPIDAHVEAAFTCHQHGVSVDMQRHLSKLPPLPSRRRTERTRWTTRIILVWERGKR